MASEEFVEADVCSADELQINEFVPVKCLLLFVINFVCFLFLARKRLVEVGETKVLLIKTAEDQFAALGNVCSHYGAPLINGLFTFWLLSSAGIILCFSFHVGVYHNGHISCPWHGACFNVKSGDIEEFPGCDSLPTYEVCVFFVHIPRCK